MTAEYDDLPPEARSEVDRFARINTTWLRALLAARLPDEPQAALQRRASAIFAAIEGAQLIARGRADITAFDEIVDTYRAIGLFS